MLGNPLAACPTGLTNCHNGACGQQCKNLDTDGKNCGICGRQCPDVSIPTETVAALKAKHIMYSCDGPNPDGGLPKCVPICETDFPPFSVPHIYKDCDGDFDKTVADPMNAAFNGCEIETFHNKDQCGDCKKKCELVCHTKKGTVIDQVCDCGPGLTWCPAIEECVDLNNDAKNCGACGNLCPGPRGADGITLGPVPTEDEHGRPTCVDKVCGYKCRGGYADCNKKIDDGCEVDTQNAHDDCGTCGHNARPTSVVATASVKPRIVRADRRTDHETPKSPPFLLLALLSIAVGCAKDASPAVVDTTDAGPDAEDPAFKNEFNSCEVSAGASSYIGCDAWPTPVANVVWNVFDFAVVVANAGERPANVTVERSGQVVATARVEPNNLAKIFLPWIADLKGQDSDFCGQVLSALPKTVRVNGGAYHLKSDRPVTVYQFNALEYAPVGGPSKKDWTACPGDLGCPGVKCFSYSNDTRRFSFLARG